MHLRFVVTELTFDYFGATWANLKRFGKPVAFYSDKHSTFCVSKVGAPGGDGMPQFGRALHQRYIDIICTNNPRVKGVLSALTGSCRTGWSTRCVAIAINARNFKAAMCRTMAGRSRCQRSSR